MTKQNRLNHIILCGIKSTTYWLLECDIISNACAPPLAISCLGESPLLKKDLQALATGALIFTDPLHLHYHMDLRDRGEDKGGFIEESGMGLSNLIA